MTIAIFIFLAWFGLGFGSFVNALVWRLHEQGEDKGQRAKGKVENLSIVSGRSVCPNCGHQLGWHDLIPVVSWLWLLGRCRYCKKPISAQYPLVELTLALVFTLSYAFWPTSVTGWQWALFLSWLASAVGLLALLVYDARYMLLPNKIIYPTLLVAVVGRTVYLLGYEPRKAHALALWALSIIVASGLFAAIYYLSQGKLIGFGDVRLGLVSGTLLATPQKSFLMIFLASIIGVLLVLPTVVAGKRNLASKVPFGPFLITATAIAVVWGQNIVDWYKRVFLP
jgi:prepilin signal peptidase PulO-like enzyme (type II secretory pathway)